MKSLFFSMVGPSLVTAKFVLAAALIYAGIATRKAFLIVFGSAVALIAMAWFLDQSWETGREADAVLSLLDSVLFAYAILLAVGKKEPTFTIAMFTALLASCWVITNGIHSNWELYKIFDASTSACVVIGVGAIVALQGASRRPILSGVLALITVIYALMQLEFYVAQWPHFSDILAVTTLCYGGLVGFTFIAVRMEGVPISVFSPKNVMIELRRAFIWE
jgi:hypothetical protein